MTDTSETDDMPTYGTSRRSAEIDKLATALAKAQGAMSNAARDATNPAFKRDGKASTYATLAAVLDAVRQPLSENGLALMQWPRTNGNGVEVDSILCHESGQYVRDTLWLPCPTMNPHAVASTVTYLRRITAMAICGVAPSDEDDGNAAADAHKDAHKPGAPGSASGGTDFLPAGRSRTQPGHSSPHGRNLAAEEPHLVANANDRPKGTNGKPPAPDERARKFQEALEKAPGWVTDAIASLRLVGQTRETLSQYLVDHHKQIRFLEDHAPYEHERFFDAFNAASEAARSRVS